MKFPTLETTRVGEVAILVPQLLPMLQHSTLSIQNDPSVAKHRVVKVDP